MRKPKQLGARTLVLCAQSGELVFHAQLNGLSSINLVYSQCGGQVDVAPGGRERHGRGVTRSVDGLANAQKRATQRRRRTQPRQGASRPRKRRQRRQTAQRRDLTRARLAQTRFKPTEKYQRDIFRRAQVQLRKPQQFGARTFDCAPHARELVFDTKRNRPTRIIGARLIERERGPATTIERTTRGEPTNKLHDGKRQIGDNARFGRAIDLIIAGEKLAIFNARLGGVAAFGRLRIIAATGNR